MVLILLCSNSSLKTLNSPKKLIMEQLFCLENFCNECAELMTAFGVAIGVKKGDQ